MKDVNALAELLRGVDTFGNLELPIYTHDIEDIGYLAAMAMTDDRARNKCVQLDYNALTQSEMLAQLKQNWPDTPFEYEHFSTEYIIEQKEHSGDEVTAKKGSDNIGPLAYSQAQTADCSQGAAAATVHIPPFFPVPTHQALQSKVSGCPMSFLWP